MSFLYVHGDATQPERFRGNSPKIVLAHVVNNIGRWGKGFTEALDKRWPQVGQYYRNHSAMLYLGDIQIVQVERDVSVANLVAQRGVRGAGNPVPIDYVALEISLYHLIGKMATIIPGAGYAVHMPRIGCGLSGGTWEVVEPILQKTVARAGVMAVVYD